ncbi:MAG: rhomboid family intramembrane serine protease, partial [Planctomycetota bacterium]|nr:rhomboid family intramembrane serine protease [Planctomycetota bacterium]
YDRDYIRRPPPGPAQGRSPLASMRMWSVNTWLIVICAGVYFIDEFLPVSYVEMSASHLFEGIPGQPSTAVVTGDPRVVTVSTTDPHGDTQRKQFLGRPVLDRVNGRQIGWVEVAPMHLLRGALYFSTSRGFLRLEFWRFIGFQFLHHDFLHLLMNMIGLYFLGPMVERYLGGKRYLGFYLLCGIAGALMYLALNLGGYVVALFAQRPVEIPGLLFNSPATPMVGASAGVFGVIMAGAFLAPRAVILFMLFLPMRLATFAYIMVAIAFVSLLMSADNAGGQAAHLGGAIAGFYFIRHPKHLHGFFDIVGRVDPTSHHYRGKRGRSVFRRSTARRGQVDRILDKISAGGLHSLTEREKRILREASQRKP